jgi:selenide,water dikinase
MDDSALVRPDARDGAGLLLTIDVITPIVDDARAFGEIAAANSLSDVYAMGGSPQVALSFVGFPTDTLPLSVLEEVLSGVRDACARARCAIVGGHTITDAEPKCGLAVVGTVDPAKAWSHRAARAGDALVLTKPLGTGIAGQAIKGGTASASMIAAATERMRELNDVARDVGVELGATSATDVTGFGLLGHLKHLVEASQVTAEIDSAEVLLLEGVLELAAAGKVPGGTRKNLAYAAAVTSFADAVPEPLRLLLADAQTSGGLLLCLPAGRAAEAVQRLSDQGRQASAIGRLVAASKGASRIVVR